MVSFVSHFPIPFNFIPRLFGKLRLVKARPVPLSAATLAKRKVERLTPSLASLSTFSPELLNVSWNNHLEAVSKELLALPDLNRKECAPVRAELKKVLDHLNLKNFELFFERLAKAEIEKPSAKSVEELLKLLDLTKIEACLKNKNPYFSGAKEWAAELGIQELRPIVAQASRAQNVVTRFFPNLGAVLLRAFNLFDSQRPPATLYEYGVLLTMYFHFFYLSYFLFKGLSAILASSATVLLTSTLIIGLSAGALYTYLRWIKKCPKQVIFCENLSEKHRQKQLHPVVGREEEFRQALACLNDSRPGTTVNLLLVGESGVGKTEFMNGLAQRLTNREVFKFKNWALFGAPNGFQSPGEKMEEAFREVKGYEQKVIFTKEMGDDKECDSFLKLVLNNESIQFVGAMTRDQYEKLKKDDRAFEQRFKPIFLDMPDKKKAVQILNEKVKARDIMYNQEALQKIFEHSDGQLRKAISILDTLTNRIHQFRIENYATPKYFAALEALNGIKAKGVGFDSPLRRPFSKECVDYLSEKAKAKAQLDACERELKEQKERAKKMSALSNQERQVQREIEILVKPIATGKGKEQQIRRFLLDTFFIHPRLGEMVGQMASGLNQEMPLRLDVALVEKVVAEDLANRKAAGG